MGEGCGTRDKGHGTWDMGHGTRDMGHGIGDTGHGTWDMGHGTRDTDMGHGTWDTGQQRTSSTEGIIYILETILTFYVYLMIGMAISVVSSFSFN